MRSTLNKALTLLILMCLVIGAFFMTNAPMPDWSHIVSGISIILFLIPTILAARSWLGNRDAFLLFTVLGLFALAIESLAIITGFPYGHFSYSEQLGYKIAGVVPWTVFFAWTPLMLAAYVCVRKLFDRIYIRIGALAVLLVVFDLVLDPGAVRMKFWMFDEKGWFYGVPFSNFIGWIFSGLLGAVILELFVMRIRPLLPTPVQLMQSGFLTVFYWTFVALFTEMYIPFLIGIAVIVFLAIVYFKFYYAFDDMVVLVDEDNNAIGTAPKLPVHTNSTPVHRAFSVFLFNKNGDLLLQKRAEHKKTWGGVWSNSCCGHVMLHEKVEDAAKRRIKFELGLNGITLTNVLPDYRYRAEKDGIVENEFCPVLVGFADIDPRINPDEVAKFKWISWNVFLVEVNDPATEFSPWAVEEARLLSESDVFRKLISQSI